MCAVDLEATDWDFENVLTLKKISETYDESYPSVIGEFEKNLASKTPIHASTLAAILFLLQSLSHQQKSPSFLIIDFLGNNFVSKTGIKSHSNSIFSFHF